MIKTRWKKVIRDLFSNKMRTVLVVLAIAVGVWAFGSVFITQEVLLVNMDQKYRASNPSTLSLNLAEFDRELVRWIEDQPGVAEAQGEVRQTAKVKIGEGQEKSVALISVPDFMKMDLDLLESLSGSWPPGRQEIIWERNSDGIMANELGEPVELELPDGTKKELVYSGMVYGNSVIPATFSNQLTGYVSWETLGWMGYPKQYNRVVIATSPEIKDLGDAEKLADNLREKLEDRGVQVRGTMVFPPNEHWAEDNSKAFTAILSIIGVFSLVLSGFLVVNTISALLAQQKKQIGVIKAIGGSNRQVLNLYLVMVVIYGVLGLLIALPIGMGLGWVFLKLVANFLNLDVEVFYLPWQVLGLEIGAAILVPLLAALVPIWQGTKTSVREAISDFEPVRKAGGSEHYLTRFKGLSRWMLISLRNTFRKKGRLALTLGTLIVAGSLFISVINIREAMVQELERILQMFDFEVELDLDKDYNAQGIVNRLGEMEMVSAMEARTGTRAKRIKADGSRGEAFGLSGLPPDTVFSHPVLLSGRWLKLGDGNAVVLSSAYTRDNSDLVVGDRLLVEIDNQDYEFEIVGIIAMAGDQKLGFVDFDYLAMIKDEPGLASTYMLKTEPDDKATQQLVAREAEERLERSGINVVFSQTKASIFDSASSQFNFMVFFLLAMAVMVAGVGGLGLAGTMSLNVLERTREIGILRSIGANNQVIRKVVLGEGILIGLISWLLAIPLSLPMSYGFGYAIGIAFFDRILVFTVVPMGMAIWLGIVMVIATVASVLPARNAVKMSIRDTLAYE